MEEMTAKAQAFNTEMQDNLAKNYMTTDNLKRKEKE
jgi:hypothetical protein